jgi:hypothetical protein
MTSLLWRMVERGAPVKVSTRSICCWPSQICQMREADMVALLDAQVWGQGFPPPLFDNEFAVVEQRLVKDTHLKLVLELGGRRFNAIWFRHTDTLPTRVRLAYRPMIDAYQGQRRITLAIEHAGN